MQTLRELLSDTNCRNKDELFQEIAKELMYNHIIQKGKYQYEIVEIEFYYYSQEHQDVITYPRKMEAGRWFFHPSGVDLTFASKGDIRLKDDKLIIGNDACFGGILIRGIQCKSNGEYIFGPLKCVDELWDNFDAFGTSEKEEYPILKRCDGINECNLRRCKRYVNIKKDELLNRVKGWASQAGLSWNDNAANVYIDGLYNAKYRYFNLPAYEEAALAKIPSRIRPAKDTLISC